MITCISIPEKDTDTADTENTGTETSHAEDSDSGSSTSDTDNTSSESGNKKRSGTSSSYKGDPDSGKPPPVTFTAYGDKENPLTDEESMIFILFFAGFFFLLYLGIMIRIIGRKKEIKKPG